MMQDRGTFDWKRGRPLLGAILFLCSAAIYLDTTLCGKFTVWSRLLDRLGLRGDERVLDLGCGRGAVLLAAAHP
jgi:arsenite methyltransferase